MSPAKPARSARKPKGEGHARRAEILAAAERIFVECGYEGATIRRIADEVGVSSTALYMHFRDKSQILHEICEAAFEQMLAFHREARAMDAAPEAKVRRMLEGYVEFGFANPHAYLLVYCTRPQEAEEAHDVARKLGRQTFDSFEETVGEIAAAGRLKTEVAVAAQTFWEGMHGLVSLQITKPYFDWADRRKRVDAMLDCLFEGLVKR